MKATARVLAICLAGAVLATAACGEKRSGQGVPWRVEAAKGVRWGLACDFAWVRRENTYDPRDYVNQLERTGSGSKLGQLLGGDGRCTLTKIDGEGPAKLILVKNGVEHAQVTDTGQAPAKVVVY